MTSPVAVAVAGALAVAAGAALQERSVVRAPRLGQLRMLSFLLRSRSWCLGTLLTAAGVVAHMLALACAPLIVIQPIGVSGLLSAVMLSAFFRRQRLTKMQVTGCLTVTAGLAGLLVTLPSHAGVPEPSRAETVLMPAGCAAVLLLCAATARFTGAVTRAWVLALGGGVAYGATSAFARVVGAAAVTDLSAVVQPLTAVAPAVGLAGAVAVQNAYRSGHFALAYATLLISDPLAAAAIGVAAFGEPLPTGPVDGSVAAAAAVLLTIGVVTLARAGRPAATCPAPAAVGGPLGAVRAMRARRGTSAPGPAALPFPSVRGKRRRPRFRQPFRLSEDWADSVTSVSCSSSSRT
ncbi:DMT family transporter [Streptomonospora salina]|uniref:Putative membrane protein n=1 Tax=Streptomonospora salina TaxID=104205 RepID=A0A841ED75_9ACTN|nr:DMT family transporter [Streptomonospora salina]MBB5999279.1 putative membrane protein [Streptomonospora salina]